MCNIHKAMEMLVRATSCKETNRRLRKKSIFQEGPRGKGLYLREISQKKSMASKYPKESQDPSAEEEKNKEHNLIEEDPQQTVEDDDPPNLTAVTSVLETPSIENALRPYYMYSERGLPIQQDSGTSGRHSPVGGIQCQPADIQDEDAFHAELLVLLFLLYLFSK
ncbi:hypothetical protein OS493_001125 [Desmophyllum pertusum]|uniref:Uncharacterized protein n=1 Tax=Desmophyllum pertusum TaxID=174260 RepID=A0A9W9ZU66_9CNID|nr:hypothetical protein OS493_001125 [Desmophyllum pertusum]